MKRCCDRKKETKRGGSIKFVDREGKEGEGGSQRKNLSINGVPKISLEGEEEYIRELFF